METISGDGSKTELVMKKKEKHKSTTGIGASLIPDYKEKEETNIRILIGACVHKTDCIDLRENIRK